MLRTRIELDEYVLRKARRGDPSETVEGLGLGGERVEDDGDPTRAPALTLPLRKLDEPVGGGLGDDRDRAGEFWREEDGMRGGADGEEDRFDPDDDLVASEREDLGVLWLPPFGFGELVPKETPESWRAPTGMIPTGSGGTSDEDEEGDRKPLVVLGEEWLEEEVEKKDPLKRALVLGADATRRRKRLADEPPSGDVVAALKADGDDGILNDVWVGSAVCGIGIVVPVDEETGVLP